MPRFPSIVLGLFAFALAVNNAHASNYGFSFNINFAANGDPIVGAAGKFAERTWNNFNELNSQGPRRLIVDTFGAPGQVAPVVNWDAKSLEILNVRPQDPNAGRLIRGFLDTPSIELTNLDRVVPQDSGPLNYSLILYTFGGRDGAEGSYIVEGLNQRRTDIGQFDGVFRPGVRGNMVIFEDLKSPDILIKTDGFAPINALSVMYCRPGDLNGDGVVDVADLDELNAAVKDKNSKPRYDINIDLNVDFNDVMAWIKWSKGTCIGDVNLDGVFDSNDLIQLFQKGTYESGGLATWTSGDWNGDCKFDSGDLLLAFQEGCYEGGVVQADSGDLNAVQASYETVPEPAGVTLLLCAFAGFGLIRRHQAEG